MTHIRRIQALHKEAELLCKKVKAKKKPKKKRGLSPEEIREYLKDPNACPYCESKNIEGGFVDIHTGGAAQPVKCVECQRNWHDIYELKGIEESR